MTFDPLTKEKMLSPNTFVGGVFTKDDVVSALEWIKSRLLAAEDFEIDNNNIQAASGIRHSINIVRDGFPFVHQLKTDSFDKAGEVFHKEWDDEK